MDGQGMAAFPAPPGGRPLMVAPGHPEGSAQHAGPQSPQSQSPESQLPNAELPSRQIKPDIADNITDPDQDDSAVARDENTGHNQATGSPPAGLPGTETSAAAGSALPPLPGPTAPPRPAANPRPCSSPLFPSPLLLNPPLLNHRRLSPLLLNLLLLSPPLLNSPLLNSPLLNSPLLNSPGRLTSAWTRGCSRPP